MQRLYPKAKFYFDQIELVSLTGALRALRKRTPLEALPTEHGGVGVPVPSADAVLVEAVRNGKITAAPYFDILSATCQACGTDYVKCPCLALLADAAEVIMEKIDLLGFTWTARPSLGTAPVIAI